MKKLSSNLTCVILVALVFAVQALIVPSLANAKYISHYDDYPGEDSLPWGTIIAVGIIGGLAVTGIALLITGNKKKDKEVEPEVENPEVLQDNNADSTGAYIIESDASILARLAARDLMKPKVNLYFDIDQSDTQRSFRKNPMDFSDMTFKIGLSYNF